MPRTLFITGTDTEIGKTTVAAALLHLARRQNRSTAAVKPVASDCSMTTEGLRNADALALLGECSLKLSYAEVNPVAFEPAIAPHLAAQEQRYPLTVAALHGAVQYVVDQHADLTLIEGAGGWRVPLNDQESLSDLAQQLGYPVILVVGIRLGCINHALLTAEAIRADGLTLAGWVANQCSTDTAYTSAILDTLRARLPSPCLGYVPRLAHPDPATVAQYLQAVD